MTLKYWLMVIRAPFLLLSCVLVFLGASTAYYNGYINITNVLLSLIGLILLHISVNTLNEYYDYKYKTDFMTIKTPFSGGSGVLPSGLLNPSKVFILGLTSFIIASIIGLYFLVTVGILLLPILILGAIFTLFYTQLLARYMVGEISAGLGLGLLPILGVAYVVSGYYSLNALIASVIPGILTFDLLFLNEFPDVEADKATGRKNLVIKLGYRDASKLYNATIIFMYIYIGLCIALKLMPIHGIIAFLTLPFAINNIKLLHKEFSQEELITAMKNNVLIVLLTPTLLGLGYIIATLL